VSCDDRSHEVVKRMSLAEANPRLAKNVLTAAGQPFKVEVMMRVMYCCLPCLQLSSCEICRISV
jgi:hypothetical protein